MTERLRPVSIEQVAIALCSWLNGKKRPEPTEQIWAGLTEEQRAAYREQAIAALAASEQPAIFHAGIIHSAVNIPGELSDEQMAEMTAPPSRPGDGWVPIIDKLNAFSRGMAEQPVGLGEIRDALAWLLLIYAEERTAADGSHFDRGMDVPGGKKTIRDSQAALRKLEATIRRQPERESRVDGWQPIESAPEDGFHLLLYRPKICFVGYYAAGGDWVINAPSLPLMDPPPTHWMPLPAAPDNRRRGSDV